MKVIHVSDLEGVQFTGGISYRPILEKDNVGFSVCKTVIPKGGPHRWQYKYHQEACYCIKGFGILTNLDTGISTMIGEDVVYLVDQHENHEFEAIEDVVLISIFNPPLTGQEKHDKDGNYTRVDRTTTGSNSQY